VSYEHTQYVIGVVNRAKDVLSFVGDAEGSKQVQATLDMVRAAQRYTYTPSVPDWPTNPDGMSRYLDELAKTTSVAPAVGQVQEAAALRAARDVEAELSSHANSFLPVIAGQYNSIALEFIDAYGDGFPLEPADLLSLGAATVCRHETAQRLCGQLDDLVVQALVVLGEDEEPTLHDNTVLRTDGVRNNVEWQRVAGSKVRPSPGFGVTELFIHFGLSMPRSVAEFRRRHENLMAETPEQQARRARNGG
jgi:hypothetical protein